MKYSGAGIGSKTFDVFNIVLMVLLCLIFIYPVLITLSVSVSDSAELGYEKASLIPKGFSLHSYKLLLSDRKTIQYYLNTILYAGSGTILMLTLTSMMAFPLTYRKFSGKKTITILLTITMFFSGGLVPYYLLVMKLGMVNTRLVMILPGAIQAWNVIIFRTFFQSVPETLKDAAVIDGASYWQVLFRIYVPLSKPLLATFALFSIVGHWNDYFTAVLFLRDAGKYPIQMLLRKVLILLDYAEMQKFGLHGSDFDAVATPRTFKSAAIIITITPILCIYPFLQKYFAKGILIGAIKE